MIGVGIWAVVPAKDLAGAKQRLAPVLGAEERRGLACAMLEDVLAALAAVPGLAGRLVVTRDAELAAIAHGFGARVATDLRDQGPGAALTLAGERLAAEDRAAAILALPADVPLASADEIGELLGSLGPPPSVSLAPALADMGTNAIAIAPVGAIPFRFGPRSFFLHQEAALERGIEPRTLRLPGLGLDLDRPEDLAVFLARPSATRSFAFLGGRGVAARLAAASPGAVPSRGTGAPP